jgi:hypothetical protein
MLARRKLQKHQLLPSVPRFAMKYFARAEDLGVPFNTTLDVGDAKRHMAETNT